MSKNSDLLGEVFDSPNGPDALKHLIEKFFNPPSYTKGDTHETARKEGQRQVVAYIVRQFEQHTGRTQAMKVIHE